MVGEVPTGRIAQLWHRFRLGIRALCKDRGALVGLVLIGLVLLMAATADFATWNPSQLDYDIDFAPAPPSGTHLLGTDAAGFDVWSRLLHGSRLSLLTGVMAIVLALSIGVPMGAISGYAGGWTDSILMRAVDVMLAFPSVVLAVGIAAVLDKRAMSTLIISVGIVNIPTIARQVRASVLQAKSHEYVTAAKAMGMSPLRILRRHVLPNCLAPIIVLSTLGVGSAILTAAGLSFLGLGPDARVAEWGVMLTDGKRFISRPEQWVIIPPGVAIAITVLGFNLVGDGLRRALDPRSR